MSNHPTPGPRSASRRFRTCGRFSVPLFAVPDCTPYPSRTLAEHALRQAQTRSGQVWVVCNPRRGDRPVAPRCCCRSPVNSLPGPFGRLRVRTTRGLSGPASWACRSPVALRPDRRPLTVREPRAVYIPGSGAGFPACPRISPVGLPLVPGRLSAIPVGGDRHLRRGRSQAPAIRGIHNGSLPISACSSAMTRRALRSA